MNGFRDKENKLRLESLFIETNKSDLSNVYTLQPFTKNGTPSLHKLYMECVNDYDFAMKAFAKSFEQFKALCTKEWFMNGTDDFMGFKSWQLEKELKIDAERRYQLEALAAEGNLAAVKELNNMDAREKISKRGRPSDDDVKKRIDEEERVACKIVDIRKRLKMA